MPSLDIAIAQSCFHNFLDHSRVKHFMYVNISNYYPLQIQHKDRWTLFRKSLQNTGKLNFNLSLLDERSYHHKAVAFLEPKYAVQCEDEEKQNNVLPCTNEPLPSNVDSTLSGDSEEIDEKEKLRRLRISKANKGNTPWNKGRKHSPETIQRIRETTKLAMQNPKVKMKLANFGHVLSQMTRERIAVGVRLGWKKRRAKLLRQENCLFDWQNVIAEASRKGFQDEEELLWGSYKILNEQLQRQWLASIEDRKVTPRPKVSKRAPKSLEQRRKIAEAIAAKWADPEYRSRVCSGMAKYHGTPEGTNRKVKRKARESPRSTRTPKKKVRNAERSIEAKVETQQPKLKKRTAPRYKDPSANSKLEMLKNIRAQRLASEAQKKEAFERAVLLISEAEKAANALEIAARRSPVARASLVEARKLIAEATRSIQSIQNKELTSQDGPTSGHHILVEKDEIFHVDLGLHERLNATNTEFEQNNDHQIHAGKVESPLTDVSDQKHGTVSCNGYVRITDEKNLDVGVYKMPTLKQMDVNDELLRPLNGAEFLKIHIGSSIEKLKSGELVNQRYSHIPNGCSPSPYKHDHVTKLRTHGQKVPPTPAKEGTKKWVCGRLVEIREGE